MTARVPDPALLQARAGELRVEAARQRVLFAERLESEWDDAGFVKLTELKSGITQEEQFTVINRQRADEKATRVAELREEQQRLVQSGDARGAEEVGEAASVGEHQVATLRRMAVEADQRLAAKRVELAEFEQARAGESRPSDEQFRDAERHVDLMEDQARDLEFAARRAQAALAIDNVDEKATAELDAEQAFARARAAAFDPAKIATVTASDVNVAAELPAIDTSWAETADPTASSPTDTDSLGLDAPVDRADSAMDLNPSPGPLTPGLDPDRGTDDGSGDAPQAGPGVQDLDVIGDGGIAPEPTGAPREPAGQDAAERPVLDGFDDGRVDAPIEAEGLVDPGFASAPEPEFAVVDDTSVVSGGDLAPIDEPGESFADDGEGFAEF